MSGRNGNEIVKLLIFLCLLNIAGCTVDNSKNQLDKFLLNSIYYNECSVKYDPKAFDGHKKIMPIDSLFYLNVSIKLYELENLYFKPKYIIYKSDLLHFCFSFNDEWVYDNIFNSLPDSSRNIDLRYDFKGINCLSLEKSINYIIRNDSLMFNNSLSTIELKERFMPIVSFLFDSIGVGRTITSNNFEVIESLIRKDINKYKLNELDFTKALSINYLDSDTIYIYFNKSILSISFTKLSPKYFTMRNYCKVDLLFPELYELTKWDW
jgi:hypothetical protein